MLALLDGGDPRSTRQRCFEDSITWTLRDDVRLTIDLPTYFDRVAAKDRLLERWRNVPNAHFNQRITRACVKSRRSGEISSSNRID